jgi:hypothetical protein
VTHFDGKFFTTLKSLLLKPGFLTEEYVKGRRMKYLDPVRMYLFVSFAFFLMYLAVGNDADKLRYSHDPELVHAIDSIIAIDKGSNDFNMKGAEINGKNVMLFNFGDNYSQGLKHYDSLQNTLPDSLKRVESVSGKKYNRRSKYILSEPVRFYGESNGQVLSLIFKSIFHITSHIFISTYPIIY